MAVMAISPVLQVSGPSETKTRPEKRSRRPEFRPHRRTDEQSMWSHHQRKIRAGQSPPARAELDAVAETNNYGRAVLRKWRRKG